MKAMEWKCSHPIGVNVFIMYTDHFNGSKIKCRTSLVDLLEEWCKARLHLMAKGFPLLHALLYNFTNGPAIIAAVSLRALKQPFHCSHSE